MSRAHHVVSNAVSVCQLECQEAFRQLADNEKKYAHYLSKACFEGGLIALFQCSPEAPAIFMLLQNLFREGAVSVLKCAATLSDVTDADLQDLLTFASAVYSNMGNYKSIGDTKIVPQITEHKFKRIVWASEAHTRDAQVIETLWSACADVMYSLMPRYREFGLPNKGVSTYYSSNISEADIKLVGQFMQERDISPYNTRVFRVADKLVLMLASVANSDKEHTTSDLPDTVYPLLGDHSYQEATICIQRGDFSPILKRVCGYLEQAKPFAANEHESNMLHHYIHSFMTGSIDSHKEASRHWVKDKGPIIEHCIGFIEALRDPHGVRGEFEGFVSMVNKATSAKLSTLVDQAEQFLTLMPWPTEYEKDAFLRPDFTSLDVLTFAGSTIWAGICLPNYDDVSQVDGFKNVSLGNVFSAQVPKQKVNFLSAEDEELYTKWKGPSFEVDVALHELLGHGSGKLFQEDKDGKLNFDKDKVLNLETGQPLTSWYQPGETWDSVFSSYSGTMEECRANSVAIYLALSRDILKIFGHSGQQADDVMYVTWLNMLTCGLVALEYYSPETKSWKQAHANGRFVILRVCLDAGESFVRIEQRMGLDGRPDMRITVDRVKINTVGKKAMGNFLMRLQMYKATADYENGQKMYRDYSTVEDENEYGIPFLDLRKIVMERKQERKFFVQVNTKLTEESVDLESYESTSAGLIESYVRRFPFHDTDIDALWRKEASFHRYEEEHQEGDVDLP